MVWRINIVLFWSRSRGEVPQGGLAREQSILQLRIPPVSTWFTTLIQLIRHPLRFFLCLFWVKYIIATIDLLMFHFYTYCLQFFNFTPIISKKSSILSVIFKGIVLSSPFLAFFFSCYSSWILIQMKIIKILRDYKIKYIKNKKKSGIVTRFY